MAAWKSSDLTDAEFTADLMPPEELEWRADLVFRLLDGCDWAGPDPYDGLTSPLAVLAVHPLLRQALLQTVKRSPVDLRPLLAVRPLRTATACGLGATACSRLAAFPLWRGRARELGRWTSARQLRGRHAGLWSYEFDVQTRWGYYPASMPNIVATAFCADGCLDSGTLDAGSTERLAAALLDDLYTGRHFAYTPASGTLIHNANLMGAALATRLALLDGMPRQLASRLLDAARSAVSVTVRGQRPDGAWPYGTSANLDWVDGFHTGYVLLRLDTAARGLGLEQNRAIDSGVRYYLEHLFDGPVPRYYADERPGRRGGGCGDPNNDATALRMASWAEERGYVRPGFADQVLEAVGPFLPEQARKPAGHATLTGPPVRRSPRWSLAPFLDALTAFHVARSAG
ncbi:hypothetical protein [Streptomyces gibsoniae]|uniref:Uncharacterized protein n=1 Tax=Streptomyces gibsoniae TaxID=3075529 RepID=A0ABU2TVR0_9ACTN|nr:hypothetical protein [Streptomyces sp. DSM 41699]MDT0465043.1 hypothetical protein [Streptomyces sp. DSM 41699]